MKLIINSAIKVVMANNLVGWVDCYIAIKGQRHLGEAIDLFITHYEITEAYTKETLYMIYYRNKSTLSDQTVRVGE